MVHGFGENAWPKSKEYPRMNGKSNRYMKSNLSLMRVSNMPVVLMVGTLFGQVFNILSSRKTRIGKY